MYESFAIEKLIEVTDILGHDACNKSQNIYKQILSVYRNNPNHILTMINLADSWDTYSRIYCDYISDLVIDSLVEDEKIDCIISMALYLYQLSEEKLEDLSYENPEHTITYKDWTKFNNIFVRFLIDIRKQWVY